MEFAIKINTAQVRRVRDALITGGYESSAGAVVEGVQGGGAVLQRVTPFVETMYLTMVADGLAAESERAAIRGAMQVLTRGLVPNAELGNLLRELEDRAREQGTEARLQAIGSHISANQQDREMAFTLAAAVALADRRIAIEESALLLSIAEWYGISESRREEILGQFDGSA